VTPAPAPVRQPHGEIGDRPLARRLGVHGAQRGADVRVA
jgi:hypothetical protein